MFENLKIIGTSHIAKDSIDRITEKFNDFKPDIVAVELDNKRYHSIMTKKESSNNKLQFNLIGKIGVSGFLFLIIGRFLQKKLGSIVGVEPGIDMKTAINLAKNNQKRILLIDRNIQITLKRFSKKFSFKEKMRLLKDLFFGFGSKQKVSINLSKVPDKEIVLILINQLKNRYPSLYKVLIDERNKHMAKQLFFMMKKEPTKKILCVIGAGHKEGLLQDLKNFYYSNPSLISEKNS